MAGLLQWYRGRDPGWLVLDRKVREHKPPKTSASKVMVCSEGLKPIKHHADGRGFPHFYKQTHLLARGDTNKKQEVVTQSFLRVLMTSPDGEKHWQTAPQAGSRTPLRRTALARWLTDTKQGAGHLLARVIVNRLWQHHLGRGIVATPNNFGAQGERPPHPKLLDWLATELIRNGWRLKPIHKLIMQSAVALQSTRFDERKAVDVMRRIG